MDKYHYYYLIITKTKAAGDSFRILFWTYTEIHLLRNTNRHSRKITILLSLIVGLFFLTNFLGQLSVGLGRATRNRLSV